MTEQAMKLLKKSLWVILGYGVRLSTLTGIKTSLLTRIKNGERNMWEARAKLIIEHNKEALKRK
jgi:hypothetical protein